MADVSVTHSFTALTTAASAEVNQNFTDLVDYINARNNGTADWGFVTITSTNANPLRVNGNQATTEVNINNTATDGDPILAFELSGTHVYTMGVDDGDSDKFKIGTTSIGSTTMLTIDSAEGGGLQIGQDPSGAPTAHTLYKTNVPKAWMTMDGTGTISITDSFNVSSLVDNGTGDYTINWNTDFGNADYAVSALGDTEIMQEFTGTRAVGTFRVGSKDNAGTAADGARINIIAIGDQ